MDILTQERQKGRRQREREQDFEVIEPTSQCQIQNQKQENASQVLESDLRISSQINIINKKAAVQVSNPYKRSKRLVFLLLFSLIFLFSVLVIYQINSKYGPPEKRNPIIAKQSDTKEMIQEKINQNFNHAYQNSSLNKVKFELAQQAKNLNNQSVKLQLLKPSETEKRSSPSEKFNFSEQLDSNRTIANFNETQKTKIKVKVANNTEMMKNQKPLLLSEGGSIINIYKVKDLKQLPFCLLVSGDSFMRAKIRNSVKIQKYRNYQVLEIEDEKRSYWTDKKLIREKCLQNSVIIYLNNQLELQSLQRLNKVHQTNNAWVTVRNISSEVLQVISFYYRIFDLLELNDFNFTNIQYLQEHNHCVQALGILQLAQSHLKYVDFLSFSISPLFTNLSQATQYNRVRYTKLFKLSQDFIIDINLQETRFGNLKKLKKQSFNYLTPQKMQSAILRQQLLYLPKNHSIGELEKIQFDALFANLNLNHVQPTRFCVTVLSHNNIDQNRYKKVLLSIFQQQYDNYHIVFFDDFSSDQNLYKSIQFTKQFGFPKERIVFVSNKKRMFATYNIVNSAFNFCNLTEVQLLVDGDDQIIGKQSFSLIDKVYRKNKALANEKWIIYSNFKSNLYTYGTSQKLFSITSLLQGHKRKSNHIIGPIRTWRVQLVQNIPLKYHQNQTGFWFDTVYDDAIQHCLVQLSGQSKVEYLPEMLYEYNKQYGNNDDSTYQKRVHRQETYRWVLSLQPLAQMKRLQGGQKQKDVEKILNSNRDQIFTTVIW